MPDIGLGEIVVIAVLALLVFGPDRLPKVAADAGRFLRQMRELAGNARKELSDAAGMQDDGDVRAMLNDLDPRRALRDPVPPTQPAAGAEPPPASAPTAAPVRSPAATADQASAVDDWT